MNDTKDYHINIKTEQAGAFRILIEALKEILPNGPRDLVREFVTSLDSQMLARISKLKLEGMPIRMRILANVRQLCTINGR